MGFLLTGWDSDNEEREALPRDGGHFAALAWHLVGSGRRNVQPLGLLSSPDPQVSDPYGRWNVLEGVCHSQDGRFFE